jgi:hypothetical protein
MKIFTFFFLAISALPLLTNAQPPQTKPELTPRIVGGYSSASVKDKRVKAAAVFAVKTHSLERKIPHKLKAIRTAQTQVVAGLNYKICLSVSEGKNAKHTHFIEAVVYQNLEQKLSLTSWAHTQRCD